MNKTVKQLSGAAALALLCGSIPVIASDTQASRSVTNTATVNYLVGGFPQRALIASSTFTLDAQVDGSAGAQVVRAETGAPLTDVAKALAVKTRRQRQSR